MLLASYVARRVLKNPKTEAKSETKRLFNTSKQREALPDSGIHNLFNTRLGLSVATRRPLPSQASDPWTG